VFCHYYVEFPFIIIIQCIGVKVREIGPLVYGYSATIGPDGKPNVREFGNVGSLGGIRIGGCTSIPQISAERESL
jgi:HSP20 family protein